MSRCATSEPRETSAPHPREKRACHLAPRAQISGTVVYRSFWGADVPKQPTELNDNSPLAILNAARKAVPAVNYALGAAGIAAAAAIIIGFLGQGQATFIILGAMLVAMLLLFAFAQLVRSKSDAIVKAGIAL